MIKELHEKLKKGEKKSVDLVKQYLTKIEKDDKRLNAFLSVFEDEALEKASLVDEKISRGEEIGLLEGIPYALKDNFCTKGKITTAASKMLENYKAPYDATVVEKINDQNGILLGKTNLDEFAMGSSTENSAFGVTRNPYDETRVAGGSSGGSAAAVAADLAAWALGSDTGGSIREPASFCNLVGLKPTYGRVSRYGLMAMASSFDQIGPITKTVEDAAIVLDAICGKDKKDNTTIETRENFAQELRPELKGKKIGIVKEFFGDGLRDSVKEVIQKRIDYAKEQGAEVVELEFPIFKQGLAVYYLMITSEVSSNLARLDGIRYGLNEASLKNSKSRNILDVYKYSRELGLGPETKIRTILGTYALSAGYYDAYYKKAQKVRELFKQEMNKAFQKVDVLLSPTAPFPAFEVGERADEVLEMYLADIYTVTINVAMIPAVSIPAGFIQEKDKELPIGLQLMGKWWDEQNLLNISRAMELEQQR